jgi:hypothetical protein
MKHQNGIVDHQFGIFYNVKFYLEICDQIWLRVSIQFQKKSFVLFFKYFHQMIRLKRLCIFMKKN